MVKRRGKMLHPLVKWFILIFAFLCTNIPTRSKDVVVITNFIQVRRFTKTGGVCVFACAFVSPPPVISVCNLLNVFINQLPMHAINHPSHLSSIDEQRLPSTIAKMVIAFVARDKPKTNRNLRVVEELARERDHTINQISFDDCLSNLAFARLV